ncbi:sigma-70 family RNA polymerase sigma factor [Frankia sp. Cpl3]|uniref:RNA polymerase sigma factor n=1 Tax=Parafrankia colletiae TaxID=573497 RepID=UPI000A8D63CB|nr:sigma-70 family RNA polymerase sigma factor [Parafrankia colletiae]MCK9903209.1 sigma-70 family RNA polymerase sigma factor [Frankia sp. Cpl3]
MRSEPVSSGAEAASRTAATTTEEWFTGLVSAVGPRLLAFLARRIDPPADAADLLAEVLMTAWRRVADLPSDGDAAAAWLFGIARHTLANHRRGQTRRAALADRLRTHLATVIPAYDALPEQAVEIRAALAQLTEADQAVLTLACWDDLTADEIAEILRITPSAVRQRLRRARERLRQELAVSHPATDQVASSESPA